MPKKRSVTPPPERKNRVMLSFSDKDYETLAEKAKAAHLPIATYARLLILDKVSPSAP